MAKEEIIIKAKQIGDAYAEKMLEGRFLSKSERAGLYKVISGSFADGYINGYDANAEDTTDNSQVLTKELLDKNGFVGDTRSAFAYNKGGVYLINLHAEVGEISIYDEKWHDTSGYICRSVNVPSLMDVQTLKQAFHLCGLHELANEFQA